MVVFIKKTHTHTYLIVVFNVASKVNFVFINSGQKLNYIYIINIAGAFVR